MILALDRPPLLFTLLLAGLATLSLTACSSATNENNGGETAPASQKHDSFLTDGKGDTLYDVQPGSPKAAGILELANTASLEVLDDDVSLDVRAAENIVEEREDVKIATLRELDDVSWVGSRAFGKLYRYADDNGYFDTNSSSGTPETIHGIEVDSRKAWAVLRAANVSSPHELDDEIGLDSRAAGNIVDARQPDLHSPNNPIPSLEKLASLDWVAERAFSKLLAYAKSRRWTQSAFHGYEAGTPTAIGIVRAANAPEGVDAIKHAFGFSDAFATKFRTFRNTSVSAGSFELLADIARLDGADQSTFDALAAHARQSDRIPESIHGIREETYRGADVVRLANIASEHQLDVDAGLDSRAAANIVRERPFESLEELVDVAYVAQTAIQKLDAYRDDYGVVNYCGDGRVAGGYLEECDDGNAQSGDGCSINCRLENICGNGKIEGGETCDDGNGVSQDGCAARTCTFERTSENGTVDGDNDERSSARDLEYHVGADGRLSGSYYGEDTDYWMFEIESTTTVEIDIWGGHVDGTCRGFYVHRDSDDSYHWEIFQPRAAILDALGTEVVGVDSSCGSKRTDRGRNGEFDRTVELDPGTYYFKVGAPSTGWGWSGDWSVGYGFDIVR